LTDEVATTKKSNKNPTPENLTVFACFRGFFGFWVHFDLEERLRAFKGQIKANKAMFRRRRLEGLFCLFLLLGFAMSASHTVKIRRSRPRNARLDLDSISGAGD